MNILNSENSDFTFFQTRPSRTHAHVSLPFHLPFPFPFPICEGVMENVRFKIFSDLLLFSYKYKYIYMKIIVMSEKVYGFALLSFIIYYLIYDMIYI